MDKREFINLYSQLSGQKIDKDEAKIDVEVFLELVTEFLKKGEIIKFMNIGSFSILDRKPRVISNPATRERMTIYPKKIVKFIPSKKVKERLNLK